MCVQEATFRAFLNVPLMASVSVALEIRKRQSVAYVGYPTNALHVQESGYTPY